LSKAIFPIIYTRDYKNTYQEIIYTGCNELEYSDDTRQNYFLDHGTYRAKKLNFNSCELKNIYLSRSSEYYAYGLLFNPFSTLIVPVDIDHAEYDMVLELCHTLLESETIEGIDVIRSSKDAYKTNYHLHIALNERRNINKFMTDMVAFGPMCPGFATCAGRYGESVLRISQKFFKNGESPYPEYIAGYRKYEDDEIRMHKNFIFPITDVQLEREAKKETKKSFNLRK